MSVLSSLYRYRFAFLLLSFWLIAVFVFSNQSVYSRLFAGYANNLNIQSTFVSKKHTSKSDRKGLQDSIKEWSNRSNQGSAYCASCDRAGVV